MKRVSVIKNLSNLLPRHSLITIYKSFVLPHLDYTDRVYEQPKNDNFCQNIKPL